MFPVKQAPRRYFVEMVGGAVLLVPAMMWRHGFIHAAPSGWRTLMLLLPMLPVGLMALAIWRFWRRTDEMQRRVMLEDMTVGAALMALVTIALNLAAPAGAPHLDIGWAWPIMGLGWGLATIARSVPNAVRDMGGAKVATIVLQVVAAAFLPTLAYALAAPHLGWPHGWRLLSLVATAGFLAHQGWLIFGTRCAR